MGDYVSYESKFMDLWGWWIAFLRPGEVVLDFLEEGTVCGRVVAVEKVKGRCPADYEEVVEVARLKDKKLCLQAQNTQPQQQREGSRPAQEQMAVPTQYN